jgi:hypothetical protein
MIVWTIIKAVFSGIFGFVAPLLAAIPPKAWMIIAGIVAVLIAVLFWNHHERAIGEARNAAAIATLDKTISGLQGQLTEAQSANQACDGSITRLELDKQTCESGRVADRQAQATTLAARNATEIKLKRDATAAHTKLQALLEGRCKAWADEPACGVEQ